MEQTKVDATKDGVSVPTTLEDYCAATREMREQALKTYAEEEEYFCYGMDTDDEYNEDSYNYEDGVEDNFEPGADDDEGVMATTAAQQNAVAAGAKAVSESSTSRRQSAKTTSMTVPLASSSSSSSHRN